MKIDKNTVVALTYQLTDAQGNTIEVGNEPLVYLHGGYDGTFPKVEAALHGHEIGYTTQIQLEPQEAFGDYDPELVKVELRDSFPEPLSVGMQFEGVPSDDDEQLVDDDKEPLIYRVTDLAEDKVVLDGNHPLAGMALRFSLKVIEVRYATENEIELEHVHGQLGIALADEEISIAPNVSRTLH